MRGLTHSSGVLTQFRVTGITSNDLKRTSAVFTLIQDSAPSSSGHQHDHTVAYSLGSLGVETLDSWLRLETAGEASKWNARPFVSMCEESACTTNSAGLVPLEASASECNVTGVACVAVYSSIEDHIGTTTIYFELSPTGRTTTWQWTRVEAWHGNYIDATKTKKYLYLNAVILHELGHVLGFKDENYHGIMNSALPTFDITSSDRNLLHKIYESHTPGEGW